MDIFNFAAFSCLGFDYTVPINNTVFRHSLFSTFANSLAIFCC